MTKVRPRTGTRPEWDWEDLNTDTGWTYVSNQRKARGSADRVNRSFFHTT
jgi:hypothetical protein